MDSEVLISKEHLDRLVSCVPQLSDINIWAHPFGSGFPLQCLNPAAWPPGSLPIAGAAGGISVSIPCAAIIIQ
ncbi:MAG: hypothetical protein B6D68_03275 [spirochete symbiont of Stewartia floridana]|nr:MAG: hypothetical protein B6D68_03275 [spirochete symbiont of Stewartia floridana]